MTCFKSAIVTFALKELRYRNNNCHLRVHINIHDFLFDFNVHHLSGDVFDILDFEHFGD